MKQRCSSMPVSLYSCINNYHKCIKNCPSFHSMHLPLSPSSLQGHSGSANGSFEMSDILRGGIGRVEMV